MRARGNERMAVLKLCDQVGARGAEKGARRAPSERSAPRAVYAQPLSVHGLPRGSAPAQSPPWAVASARSRPERVGGMREWPPGAGNAGRSGVGRGEPRAASCTQEQSAWGCWEGGKAVRARGREEEGGRRERGSEPRCPGPLPAPGKRLAGIPASVQ